MRVCPISFLKKSVFVKDTTAAVFAQLSHIHVCHHQNARKIATPSVEPTAASLAFFPSSTMEPSSISAPNRITRSKSALLECLVNMVLYLSGKFLKLFFRRSQVLEKLVYIKLPC